MKYFGKENYTVTTGENEYKSGGKIKYICDKNHPECETIISRFNNGARCPYCAKNKIDEKGIKDEMDKLGYSFEKYEKGKLYFTCNKGHYTNTTWSNWKSGSRCKYCSGYKFHINDVVNRLNENNYVMVSELPNKISRNTLLKIKCKNGHMMNKTVDKILHSKLTCLKCRQKETLNKVFSEMAHENYKYLSHSKDKIYFICPNNHKHEMFFSNWYNGQRCGKCGNGYSNKENELKEWLSTIGVEFKEHDRVILKPKELDVFIPSHNLAIEFDGIYFHSELTGTPNSYHLEKTEKCEDKNIKLIHVFENEWIYKNEIVKSRIRNLLNLAENKIFARKCEIKEIPGNECKYFLEENHIQGFVGSKIKIGAIFQNELIAVMTFSKENAAKGSKANENVFEMNRFCVKNNYSIVGIADKMFKFFILKYNPLRIISFADRRWSQGDLYFKLGFNFVHNTKPNYWYFKTNDGSKLYHRFNFRKSKLNGNGSEWEIMKNNGWNRIWDCGSKKFEWINNVTVSNMPE